MPYQIPDPIDIPRLQQILDALQAEIDEREQATTALGKANAELYTKLQRRLAESESSDRVACFQKTVLDQVLDIVCTEAPGLDRGDRRRGLAADRSGLAGSQAPLGQAFGGRRPRACGWLFGRPGGAPG